MTSKLEFKRVRPCRDGSLRDAGDQRGRVRELEARHADVRLAIQRTAFDPKKQPARNVTRVTLRGHKADCVKDHGLAMLVPLAAGHVLRVAAPCPIASGFASKALARLYP